MDTSELLTADPTKMDALCEAKAKKRFQDELTGQLPNCPAFNPAHSNWAIFRTCALGSGLPNG